MSCSVDIHELERERFAWALKTFPNATTFGSLDKLRTWSENENGSYSHVK